MCLPFPHFEKLNTINNFNSNYIAFNYKDLTKKRHIYSEEKEKIIHKVEDYMMGLGFNIIDFPVKNRYSEVLEAVKNLKFLFSLFMGGSFVEILNAGGLPILTWPPNWGRPILHKQKAIDLGVYIEYPLDLLELEKLLMKLTEDEIYFTKVLSGYRELFVENDFETSKKYFDKICERI
jgi:hypothetical protein